MIKNMIVSVLRSILSVLEKEVSEVDEYAYKTVNEWAEIAEIEVTESMRIVWNMARTTNKMLGITKDDEEEES